MLRKLFKVLHLLGLTLFLGSVFAHIVASAVGGDAGNTPAYLQARQQISAATEALTLPGLGLALLSGAALLLCQGRRAQPRWVWLHAAMALGVLVITATLIVPAGDTLLAAASALHQGSLAVSSEVIAQASRHEDMFGALNVLLTLAAIALAVFRPALGKK